MSNVFLAFLVGILAGLVLAVGYVRAGLDRDEWGYFLAFFDALKSGRYAEVEEEDNGSDGEENP